MRESSLLELAVFVFHPKADTRLLVALCRFLEKICWLITVRSIDSRRLYPRAAWRQIGMLTRERWGRFIMAVHHSAITRITGHSHIQLGQIHDPAGFHPYYRAESYCRVAPEWARLNHRWSSINPGNSFGVRRRSSFTSEPTKR